MNGISVNVSFPFLVIYMHFTPRSKQSQMLLIILVCCLFLLLIFLGYVAIKIFGFTRGVKSIYSFVSFFRKEERYDTVNSANAQAYNAECPFCLKKTDSPVMASCNHAYCGKCILEYYVRQDRRKLDCPSCKQPINLLIRNFEPSNEIENRLKIGVCEYNKNHSANAPLIRSIKESAGRLPQIMKWVTSREGIAALYQGGRLKTIIFSLIYMASPIDILPEALLGPLGLIDDSLVGMNLVRTLGNYYLEYVRSRDEAELRRFREQHQQLGQPQREMQPSYLNFAS